MAHLQAHAVKQITEICERYKGEPTPLMMILSDIQKEYGYIPLEVQELVSSLMSIPVAEIYGVVTFYSFFSLITITPIFLILYIYYKFKEKIWFQKWFEENLHEIKNV